MCYIYFQYFLKNMWYTLHVISGAFHPVITVSFLLGWYVVKLFNYYVLSFLNGDTILPHGVAVTFIRSLMNVSHAPTTPRETRHHHQLPNTRRYCTPQNTLFILCYSSHLSCLPLKALTKSRTLYITTVRCHIYEHTLHNTSLILSHAANLLRFLL